MADIYIERELLIDRNGTEEVVAEADILSFGFPLVVLGDPGIGKTKFAESLAAQLGSPAAFSWRFRPETQIWRHCDRQTGCQLSSMGWMNLRRRAEPRRSTRSSKSSPQWVTHHLSFPAVPPTGTGQRRSSEDTGRLWRRTDHRHAQTVFVGPREALSQRLRRH